MRSRSVAIIVFAIILGLVSLTGCSGTGGSGASSGHASSVEHSDSLRGSWCLEAGTANGDDSLSFESVDDENNKLVADASRATVTIDGVPCEFFYESRNADGDTATYKLTANQENVIAYATVTKSSDGGRDTVLITSGYDNSVRIAGVREDDAIPEGETSIGIGWSAFSGDATTGKKNAVELGTDSFVDADRNDNGGTASNEPTTVTPGMRNALNTALAYLDTMAFSRQGLIEQLEYEGYTHAEAEYGADHTGADWNKEAVRKAKEYLETMSFSRQRLIEQLEYEGFTSAQAEYGVSQAYK